MKDFYKAIYNESTTGYVYLKIILDDSGVAIDSELIEANAAFQKLTGMDSEQMKGKRFTAVFPEIKDDSFDWIAICAETALTGKQREFERFFAPLNKWYKFNIFSCEKGFFVVQFYDITKQVESDDEKTAMLLSLNDIVFELNEQYVFEKVFVENEEYLFLPQKEIIGKKVKDIFPSDLSAQFIDGMKKSLSTGKKCSIVYRSPVPNDNRWFEAIIKYDSKSLKKRYIVSVGDITNQNQLKEDLYQKTEELQKFFDVSLDLLCIADFEGNFVKVNKEWERMLGYSQKYLEKRKFLDFVHPEDIKKTIDTMSDMTQNIQALNFINRYRCKNGSYRYVEWRSHPEEKLIYAAARDITESINEKQSLEKMVKFSEEFLQVYDTDLDYTKITKDLKELTEAKFAAFNLYEEDGLQYRTMAVSADKGIIQRATDMLGIRVQEKLWDHDPIRAEKISNKLITVFKNLSELTGEVISKPVVSLLNTTFGLGETIIIKIQRNNIMLGDFTIIMPKKKPFDKHDIAEVYSRQIGLVITQKRTEKKLKESQERYQLLSDVTVEGVLIHKNGMPRDLNDSLCRLIGNTREELLKKNLIDVIHMEDRDRVRRNIASNFTGIYTVNAVKDNGEIFTAELQGREINIDGENLRVVAIRDVTKQKKAEMELKESNARYDDLARQSRTIAWEIDAEGLYTYVSDVATEVFGFEPDELIGKQHFYDLHPAPEEFKDEAFKVFLRKEAFINLINPIITKTGNILWFSTNGMPILDEKGDLKGYRGSDIDITQRKLLQEQVYNEKERFKTTLLSVGDGVISTDKYGKVLILNKVAEELTGWTQNEALGKNFEEVFNIINEFSREKLASPVDIVLENGNIIELANHTILISKNGEERPIEDSAAPIKDENGNITGVVLVFRDFTDKKEKQDRILYLSYNDQLTGLYNRRFFEEELLRIDNDQNYPLTLVMLDVNGLKLTNDAFGHLIGDKVLKTVADIMKECCREQDKISRIGGDEFVILLPKTSAEDTANIVRRIGSQVNKKKIEGINLSISYGWNTKESKKQDIMETFKLAEDQMYRQKLSESQSMRHNTISVIVKTLYEKSQREEMHSKRVSELCGKIGKVLELSDEEINELKTAGLMHDIGKIAIEDETLNKAGKLTEAEWMIIKRHPEIGYKILESVNEFAHLAKEVLQHHERWDGKGYPKGVKGEEIEFKARIIAIADAYDSMTFDRPYRKGMSKQDALREMIANAGTQFDPKLTKVFVEKILCEKWAD